MNTSQRPTLNSRKTAGVILIIVSVSLLFSTLEESTFDSLNSNDIAKFASCLTLFICGAIALKTTRLKDVDI